MDCKAGFLIVKDGFLLLYKNTSTYIAIWVQTNGSAPARVIGFHPFPSPGPALDSIAGEG